MKKSTLLLLMLASFTASFSQVHDCGVTVGNNTQYITNQDLYGLCADKNGNIFYSNFYDYIYKNHQPWIDKDGNGQKYFSLIWAMTVNDENGDLYAYDTQLNQVFNINPNGNVTIVAGTKNVSGELDGPALSATLSANVSDIVYANNSLYMSGRRNIRKLVGGNMETISNSIIDNLTYDITTMTKDENDNVYFSDGSNIWKIDAADNITVYHQSGISTHYYVDDSLQRAGFSHIKDMFFGTDKSMYILDNEFIRRVSPEGFVFTHVGNNGSSGSEYPNAAIAELPGYNASLKNPAKMIQLPSGEIHVTCENYTNDIIIRTVNRDLSCNAENIWVSTVWGNGYANALNVQPGRLAEFRFLSALGVAPNGDIYIGEDDTNDVIKMDTQGNASMFYDGLGNYDHVDDIAINSDGLVCVASDDKIVVVDQSGNVVRTIYDIPGYFSVTQMKFHPDGDLYFTDDSYDNIRKVNITTGQHSVYAGGTNDGNTSANEGFENGDLSTARFLRPSGIDIAANGDIYIADAGNQSIRKISNGQVTTLITDPSTSFVLEDRMFSNLYGLQLKDGKIYISDQDLRQIKTINLSTLEVKVVAGEIIDNMAYHNRYIDGIASIATFNRPIDLDQDKDGDLLIVDYSNKVLRKIGGNTNQHTNIEYDFGATQSYKLYPNPTSHFLMLESKENYTVYDLQMRELESGQSNKIDVSGLTPGLYILYLTDQQIGLKFYKLDN